MTVKEQLQDLRRELAALRSLVTRAGLPRDPAMLRMAETRFSELAHDIVQLERRLSCKGSH